MTSWELGKLDFYMPANVVFGWGRVGEIADLALGLGRKALLVTMPDLSQGEQVRYFLARGGLEVTVHAGCEPEPTVEGIDAAWAELGEREYDFIVGVGGGSAMDTAKAFAVLQAGGGGAWEYTIEAGAEQRPVPANLLPIIAVPTTAGTGSEVTHNSVLTNRALAKKAPIRSPRICPRIALIDPDLTLSMPLLLTASTGFDAWTHAYERYFGTEVLSPFIHQLSLNAMAMVVEHLETAIAEPHHQAARTAMSWAATQAGMVVVAAGGEAALHVFGLPIGAVAHIPHGQALAIVTQALTRHHGKANPRRGAALGRLFGLELDGAAPDEVGDALAEAVVAWLKRIGLPHTLGGHGIGAERIPEFVDAISLTRVGNVFGPQFGRDDTVRVYKQSL
jgi:alcohol dehydrogenase class IV